LSSGRCYNVTRSQAVAKIADHTASQQTLVISDALPMKLHAVNSTRQVSDYCIAALFA